MSQKNNIITKTIKNIDFKTFFIAVSYTLTILYYYNPLINIDLVNWDRTFCPASMSGISIGSRINNFYFLFLILIPFLVCLLIFLFSFLFIYRPTYKNIISNVTFLTLFTITGSYISRYFDNGNEITDSFLVTCIIGCLVILVLISLFDIKSCFDLNDITFLLLLYFSTTISLNLFFSFKRHITGIIISIIFTVIFGALLSFLYQKHNIFHALKRFAYMMMWFPFLCRFFLELLYINVGKGVHVPDYTFCLIISFVFYIIVSIMISLSLKGDFSIIGYIGTIISISTIGFISSAYQYTWSYEDWAHVYELGNDAVAMDTILFGKLPVLDYFSAHALSDVWTKIIYCICNSDLNGIFADPYAGLSNIISAVILFFLIRELFDKERAVLFVILFPGLITGIKWISLCGITIIFIVKLYKDNNWKSCLLFWFFTLLSAFTIYDEGISLGLACILSYLLVNFVEKKYINIRKFILSGFMVGLTAGLFGFIYCIFNEINCISRIKEWLSLSLGSNSTWATDVFGESSSFAFVFSYFIVPISAVTILLYTVFQLIKHQKNHILIIFILIYSITELLYISRTIVYHNLTISAGWTGVLLNYVHWTVSCFVLYLVSKEKNPSEEKRFLSWIGIMVITIIIEGVAVTNYFPNDKSSYLSKALYSAEGWDLKDEYQTNYGTDRILPDDSTGTFIAQFNNIFNLLLKENETFLDFANITSLYALTDRVRPSYVGQTPSLLTNIYTQECYLNEISKYECPLVIMGTSKAAYVQQMEGIPHSLRYYKIAEYIYQNYRPMLSIWDFSIWCKNDKYDEYQKKLESSGAYNEGTGEYRIDYGFDMTSSYSDDYGNIQYDFKPYHIYDLNQIPYIWANYDKLNAINNSVLDNPYCEFENLYRFDGSQYLPKENGNYLKIECDNYSDETVSITVLFIDSSQDGYRYQYSFKVIPGSNYYLIRISADNFWYQGNINTIYFETPETISINQISIIEGD